MIKHHVSVTLRIHDAFGLEISEMLGNFHLRLVHDVLEVEDAKRAIIEKIKNTQARLIAQALVDADQGFFLHNIPLRFSLTLPSLLTRTMTCFPRNKLKRKYCHANVTQRQNGVFLSWHTLKANGISDAT